MTLIKKRDVNDYFAARRLNGKQIRIVPASQPDATGFSGKEPVPVDATPLEFRQDFTADHSSSGTTHPSAGDSNATTGRRAPAAVGRVRE